MSKRLLYGVHSVEEALRSSARRDIVAVYTMLESIERQSKAAGVSYERKTKHELDALAGPGCPHQGALAVVGEFRYAEAETILETPGGLVLALDSMTDPQNVGALVRSAHVLGASGVLLPKDRSAQVSPAVVRASAGATEHMPIALVTNLVRSLEMAKERGFWTVGAVSDEKAEAPWAIDFREATVLVIGAESTGLRPLVRRACDHQVRIPMAGRIGSLNAAAAGAVLMYEAMRQRGIYPCP